MILLSYLEKKGFFDELKDKSQLKTDILSGLTVALALIPEAIAFSFVAKVDPMVWLWAAFIMWLMTSIFGWRPWMISGATWAMAVTMTALVVQFDNQIIDWIVVNVWLQYLLVAVILAWVLQVIFWLLKLWKIVRLIPHSVMLGFVNWLAIIIFMAQMSQFQTTNWDWITWNTLYIMLFLIFITMFIIHFLPKLTKSIPSGLVAIVFVTIFVAFVPFLSETGTVSTYLSANWFESLKWGFPTFHIPLITDNLLNVLILVFPYSVILAIIGLTESLMTLSLIDELTETRWKWNKEAIWQWVANITCGFFWAMWWCAMIGQSMINISNWWRKRISWISASIFLILFVVFWTSFIMLIPLAALVWLMFMVVIWTFAWPTIKMINKIPRSDAFVLISVTLITAISHNLALAVVSWIIISALVFAWQKSQDIHSKKYINNDNITHYELDWPLFFASVEKFKSLFDIKNDTNDIIIDFTNSKVLDHSGIEAINWLTEKYIQLNKTLHLKHLSPDCIKLLKNAEKIVDINILEDPKYFVADDKLAS